jgi:hypothetical protein
LNKYLTSACFLAKIYYFGSIMKYLIIVFIFILAQFTCSKPHAETLPQTVNNLKLLKLHYGANNVTINNQKILIVKGRVATGNAWEQDHYIVMEQYDDTWQIIHNEQENDDVVARAVPHTGEDSISSVYFMVPKNSENLYLLEVARKYKENPTEMVAADISLSILNHDEFGASNFHKLQKMQSKEKYCNSDSAAYHELGITLPGATEFQCLNN